MIFVLLVVYQFKHFLADFPLQGKYMLGKFKDGFDWILPLLAHVSVHGAFTFVIALCCKPSIALYLALFDMSVHFVMDRVKASPYMLGRFKALSGNEMKYVLSLNPNINNVNTQLKSNTYFWWSLGLDQMVHHLTHYVIIWFLVKS